MRARNILGIIFANMYDDCLHELTASGPWRQCPSAAGIAL